MMSLGRIFLAMRLCITGPIDAHSLCFSWDSAGKDEDPGSVIPMASAALAIVFAVYIFALVIIMIGNRDDWTYAPTGARAGTRVSNGVITFLFGLGRLTIL